MGAGHLDTLAAGESVGLDDKLAELRAVLLDAFEAPEHSVLRIASDVVPDQEVSCERLARLDLRKPLCRADTRDPELGLKGIDDADRERPLGTDEDEIRPMRSCRREDFLDEVAARSLAR